MGIKLSHSDEGLPETHEINVTPFIDVMLVLLIIFMVTAPLTTVDVPVNLPVSSAQPTVRQPDPVFVTIQANLTVAIGDRRVTQDSLASAIASATKGDRQTPIFLRADKTVDYGHLMDLLNVLRNAGYLKVALVGLQSTSDSGQSDGSTH